jgi:hypothetical protein
MNRVTDGDDNEQGAFASQLDWALFYISLGLAVFPVAANKRPVGSLTPHGCKDASRDESVIHEWWSKRPHADVALAIDVDMVVADCDEAAGQHGIADLERLAGSSVLELGAACCSTVSGGVHVYFAAHGRRYTNRRIPGTAIDVKAFGGYVVLPGHANGRIWLKPLTDAPLPPAPSWLDPALKGEPLVLVPRAVLASPPPPDPWARRRALKALERACYLIAAALPGFRDSTRHAQCFFLGGLIERGDIDYSTVHDAVLAAMRVHPPRDDLEERIARSIESGMKFPLPVSEAELFMRALRARMAAQRMARRAGEATP